MAAPGEHFFERTSVRWALGALVGLVLLFTLGLALTLTADEPRRFTDIEEHFKYGSIGSEPGVSLLRPVGGVLPPYWVFTALPSICSDKLPGGYADVRIHRRARTRPADRCLAAPPARHRSGRAELRRLPHRHRARYAAAAPPRIVLGMPAHQLDLQAFVQFVLDCTLDNRLTADAVRGRVPGAAAARRCSSGCSCASASSIG